MPQSRTSSIRYASRIGIGALTLALGSAALTAPAASATFRGHSNGNGAA